jgi:sialic acid synthase SpsE
MAFSIPTDGVCVIAEIGSNHNGDFALACELLRRAAAAGADVVKFQRYDAALLVHKDVPTMAHVSGIHKTQRERMHSLQFNEAQWRQLAGMASELGVGFMASGFDETSIDALDAFVPAFKIASGDLTHLPLIRHAAAKGKPVVISTGMATEDEIAAVVSCVPAERLVLMYCVSRYPTPPDELDLLTIPWMKDRFQVAIGYSDHTVGTTAAVAAVALGAVLVEKHFTLDKTQPVGDHKLSAEPDEFMHLVTGVGEAVRMRGRIRKSPRPAELTMRRPMRRGLYARKDLPAGAILTADDVIALRPEAGLPPGRLTDLIGRRLVRDVAADSVLSEDAF